MSNNNGQQESASGISGHIISIGNPLPDDIKMPQILPEHYAKRKPDVNKVDEICDLLVSDSETVLNRLLIRDGRRRLVDKGIVDKVANLVYNVMYYERPEVLDNKGHVITPEIVAYFWDPTHVDHRKFYDWMCRVGIVERSISNPVVKYSALQRELKECANPERDASEVMSPMEFLELYKSALFDLYAGRDISSLADGVFMDRWMKSFGESVKRIGELEKKNSDLEARLAAEQAKNAKLTSSLSSRNADIADLKEFAEDVFLKYRENLTASMDHISTTASEFGIRLGEVPEIPGVVVPDSSEKRKVYISLLHSGINKCVAYIEDGCNKLSEYVRDMASLEGMTKEQAFDLLNSLIKAKKESEQFDNDLMKILEEN